jgi:FAD:protein FMN transferase
MPVLDRFRAMGTIVEVQGPGGVGPCADALTIVRRRFAEEEQRFSRFRGDSELSAVNRAAGGSIRVSPVFAEVLGLALEAAARTEGTFDPTVHDALLAAGYDRDFDEVVAGARGELFPAVPCGRWSNIELHGLVLRSPRDVHVDLGGIAKGWTADRAAEDAVARGLPWVLVNAGGDMRLAGDAPPIGVHVEDPLEPERIVVTLRLHAGALATSSAMKRAWGDGRHHLIDPITGAPADVDVLQATAWAPICADAEILAKIAMLRPEPGGIDGVLVTATDVLVRLPTEMAA